MNKLRIVASVVTLAVLAAIILRTDLAALNQSLARISWGAIIGCLVLVQVQIVLSALRWRFTSARLGQNIGRFKAIREYYVASFLNQTLPGGVGGDAVRAWRMRGDEPGGWKQPAKAVVFERVSGQIAFFALAATGLTLWPFITRDDFGQQVHYILVIAITVSVVTLIAVSLKKRSGAAISTLNGELMEVFVRRKAWLFQAVTSVGILASYISVFFIAAQATGSELPWVACLTVIPFSLVAMLIPTGFGGWGTREAAAMALWPMLGASSVDGIAASITYGWLSLAGAAPGIVFLAAEDFRKRPSDA